MNEFVAHFLEPIAAFLIALLISVGVIPWMIRLAPRIGMVDAPDPRKVHRVPIARVGGFGIAIGALAAVFLFAPHVPFTLAYVFGAVILSVFGAWDDAREIGHYPKFIGQIAAAAIVVYYGGVWIAEMPFFPDPVPEWFGKPFTIVAIVGVINAINHSDGLDGLAGGEALLSLAAISCLAYVTGSAPLLIFTAAVGGGLLGFVRYNTYPARVFMGDLGSQFLGFSVAILAISLTQQVNPSLSKSLALLLVGLPIVDILAVLFQRIRAGMNWFRATRNHIHHRLLDLGFDHYQAVLLIYSVQAAMTFIALALAYESEILILSLYVGAAVVIFSALILAERKGWKISSHRASLTKRLVFLIGRARVLSPGLLLFVEIAVPVILLLISSEIADQKMLQSMRIYAAVLVVVLAAFIGLGIERAPAVYRLALYSSVGMIAYCVYNTPTAMSQGSIALLIVLAGLVALAVAFSAIFGSSKDFSANNMDFLIIAALIAAALFSRSLDGTGEFWTVAITTTVILYACELIILRGTTIWNRVLNSSALGALAILLSKALI